MGNRIIKESICSSPTIDQLSWFEEAFFYRLIVNCDDMDVWMAEFLLLNLGCFR